jgi:hypothetical protein
VQQFLELPDRSKIELAHGCQIRFLIHDTISSYDGQAFSGLMSWLDAHAKLREFALPNVYLNTGGGSVIAAIAMAKAIRGSLVMRRAGSTVIALGDSCYSACVIVLAGSYRRDVFGRVGIHRPYFVGDEYTQMGYHNLKQAYDGLYEKLSALFKQWNLSRSFVDDMFAVPSTDVHILTDRELSAYGLNKDDWVLTEEFNVLVRNACGDQALAKSESSLKWWDSAEGEECRQKMNVRSNAK